MRQRDERLSRVTGGVVIVGIDVAKRKHWASVMGGNGFVTRQSFRFDNTRQGFDRGVVEETKQRVGAVRVMVGMDPTGHYWKPLAWYLRAAGHAVVMVNPHHVKRSNKLEDNSPTKSDRKDAGLIASRVRQGKFMPCLLPEGVCAVPGRDRARQRLQGCLEELKLYRAQPEQTERRLAQS